jgi:DNA polymerase (family 10)
MTNHEIIQALDEIAGLLEVQNENKFKIRAYLKLSGFLAVFNRELSDIYAESGKHGILDIPNVGEGIGKKIIELIETGKLAYLEDLKKSLPKGIETLLKIPGMGPHTAILLGKKFGIKNVPELEIFLKSGKLLEEKGFKEKSVEKILKGIEIYKKGDKRKLLGEAYPQAMRIIDALKKGHKMWKIMAAGSIRRMEDTVGDIDILCVSEEREAVMDAFVKIVGVDSVLVKGEKKSSVRMRDRIQVDLRVFEKKKFGAALQYFTGNKQHNVIIREMAVKKGLMLNEYGLFKGKKKIAGETEESIYEALGMQYIPPEIRTGSDEVKEALAHRIPVLVKAENIMGDIHVHSEYSDGQDSIIDIAEKAKQMGYEYIAVTDHSASLKVASGLDEAGILRQIRDVEAVNKKVRGIYVFKGTETDIKADGSLDHNDRVLEKLDVVIGSVHQDFKMSGSKMTERILKAMDNKYLNVIGHISGRLINIREPYELDYQVIFDKAAKTGVAIEINGNPERLDLADIYIRQAIKSGVKLAVTTDSHSVETFSYMKYAIGKARRGWATKADIINTLNFGKFKEWCLKRRK